MNVPTLESQRITLRPFHETDMEIIKSLLNDPLATSNPSMGICTVSLKCRELLYTTNREFSVLFYH